MHAGAQSDGLSMRRRFRVFDHTGDVGVMVYGATLPELFAHAAEALFHIMTVPRSVRENEARRVSLEAGGLEVLLVAWLNEFLYLFDTESLLFKNFDVLRVDETSLDAIARGETYDPQRHRIHTTIKAVTHHQLRIRRERGVWKTRIVFDI